MERKIKLTGQDENLLSGFRLVFIESHRKDLEPKHKEYVEEALNEIAKNCVNHGMGLQLAKIRDDIIRDEKLVALRKAWQNGELAE